MSCAALQEYYDLPFDRACMHEFVFSANRQKALGVHALDIAKRLLDFGIHPPTNYFPLIVPEALMIEPTETETKETLDEFIAIMRQIAGRPRSSRASSWRRHTTPSSGGWTRRWRRASPICAGSPK